MTISNIFGYNFRYRNVTAISGPLISDPQVPVAARRSQILYMTKLC